ncbi:MAG: shikimate kinase, partial [Bdellovibrionota bacterium]
AIAFRTRETELLREVSQRDAGRGLVIATGGGFVDEPESLALVASSPWPKFWLDPPAATLWERLGGAPDRRKIGNLTDFPAMLALLEKRRPFYEKIATSRNKSQDISECLASLKMVLRKL